MVYEGLGLGAGSGPLTARYMPPFGAMFHFLRPGTIKISSLPKLPILGGDKRTLLDVTLYVAHVVFLLQALLAPAVTPELLLPTVILLPILGISDRTIFLSARAEHYFVSLLCFLFPADAISANKLLWIAIWFWAATSKLNRHFPSVIGVMISNSAVLRFTWLRKRLYKRYPDDLRPSPLATRLAHFGTIVEYTFPLLLIFGDGGTITMIGLLLMFSFHLFITSNVPMAVPIEWNFIMVYGAFVLFEYHAHVPLFSVTSPILIILLLLFLVVLPIIGNLYPEWLSFLLSMRYYAGNWAYSVWLFRGDAEAKLDEAITKVSPILPRQLGILYDEKTIDSVLSMVIAFRMMHLHGRALHELVPKAVDDIDAYTWRDGELVAGVVLGWNFGDGHLHREQLLNAIQARCHYEAGELRCIFVESQPFGQPHLDWRIVDAKEGLLEAGRTQIDELMALQPWPEHVS